MAKKQDNFQMVIQACREAITNGDTLSEQEVISQFSPEYLYKTATYGSIACLCGHPIKYAWGVRLKSNEQVLIEPIGSECIKHFVGSARVNQRVRLMDALWTMLDSLKEHCAGEEQYTLDEAFVCADNGFTSASVEFLETHGLDFEKAYLLRKLMRGRDVHVQFERQRCLCHCIAKQALEILNRELKEV